MCARDKKLAMLLNDFGYKINGSDIVSFGIPGFYSQRTIGRCRDIFDGAQQLCSVIHNKEYTDRFVEITQALTGIS